MKQWLVWLVIPTLVFGANVNGMASGLFTHPSKGYFSWQAADPWYYDQAGRRLPDKFEHFWGNYLGARLLKGQLGWSNTATIATTMGIDIAKEMADGYREGFSMRDMLANSLGCTAGILQLPIACTYSSHNNTIMLVFYHHW